MGTGFEFALSEVSLVLFTTLAPSGAVAFVLMSLPLFDARLGGGAGAGEGEQPEGAAQPGGASQPEGERARLSKLLCIPLVVAMAGLVASATHLGNPDNALYVIAGIGRSPLSNEVASAVGFLAFAGVYWLLSFSQRFPLGAQRVWLALTALAAAVFVWSVANAYGRETIPTWNLWEVPAALILNSLVGGPAVALAGFRAARLGAGERHRFLLLGLAAAALAANLAVYILQGIDLGGLRNAFGPAAALAPGYWPAVAAFALLCAAGLAALASARRFAERRLALLAWSLGGCALVLAGIFVMRFAFYMSHMTVGL